MNGRKREPSRITRSSIAVLPAGDIAELVVDSGNDAWCHWHTAESGWSPWWHLANRPEDVAIAAPWDGPDGPAALIALVSWQPEPQSATERSITPAACARTFWTLTADGLSPAGL